MDNFLEFIKKYKCWIICSILITIVIVGYIFFINNGSNVVLEEEDSISLIEENVSNIDSSLETINEMINIDIKGEVINPGVYELSKGSRVVDAIEISGGVTKNADTSNINLSKILSDENVIIVSSKKSTQVVKYIEKECNCSSINDACISDKDIIVSESEEQQINSSVPSKISINTATKTELMNLNGIGESKATDIINYRNENGLFQSIEDIKNVSGIGDKLFEKIKNQITT